MAGDFESFKKSAEQTDYETFQESGKERNAFVDFAQQVGGNVLDTLESMGGPSYAVERTEEGFAPAKSGVLREQAGIPEQSDTLAGRAAQASVEAAKFAIPVGAVAQGISKAPVIANAARTAIQNALSSYGVAFTSAPLKTTAVEAGLGVFSGTGGWVAEQMFPDSGAARFVGEVLGGSAPAVATASGRATARTFRDYSGVGWIGKKIAEIWKDIQPSNSSNRMVARVNRATPDVSGALASMDDDLLGGLTPAGKTGDRGILALEKSVDNALNDADKFLNDSIETVNANLSQAISSFIGSPDKTRETYLRAQGDLNDYLNGLVASAAQRTEQSIAAMSPTSSRETANNIAAGELRIALTAARVQERALYNLVPQDSVVPTNASKKAYQTFLAETPVAQIDDIPAIARTHLGRQSVSRGQRTDPISGRTINIAYSPRTNTKETFGVQSTIKEMRGLQSKLREVARNSRSGDNANLNRARIADSLADAITDDIALTEGGEEVAGLVQAAVGYSRDLNNKFRKGTVGNLLGYKQGAPKVPSGLVLENSIGVSGARAREAFDDIIKATDSPQVNAAMEDFIKNKFFDFAVRDGVINPSSASAFLRTNKEVLGRLPKVNADLEKAMESLDVQDLRMAQRGRVSFDKPSVSRATMFIRQGPEKAFKQVLDSRNSPREMQNLVNMANRDTTGEALFGLQSAFSEYIQQNIMDGNFISGEKLKFFLTDPKTKSTMNKLYSDSEMNRWEIIGRTAERLDLQRKSKASSEGVLGDKAGKLTSILVRLLGARSGTVIAGKTGIGGIQAQSIMSQAYQDALQKGLDPANNLIKAAIQDEDLFKKILMADIAPDGSIAEPVKRRLNAWIATLGNDEEENGN